VSSGAQAAVAAASAHAASSISAKLKGLLRLRGSDDAEATSRDDTHPVAPGQAVATDPAGDEWFDAVGDATCVVEVTGRPSSPAAAADNDQGTAAISTTPATHIGDDAPKEATTSSSARHSFLDLLIPTRLRRRQSVAAKQAAAAEQERQLLAGLQAILVASALTRFRSGRIIGMGGEGEVRRVEIDGVPYALKREDRPSKEAKWGSKIARRLGGLVPWVQTPLASWVDERRGNAYHLFLLAEGSLHDALLGLEQQRSREAKTTTASIDITSDKSGSLIAAPSCAPIATANPRRRHYQHQQRLPHRLGQGAGLAALQAFQPRQAVSRRRFRHCQQHRRQPVVIFLRPCGLDAPAQPQRLLLCGRALCPGAAPRAPGPPAPL
jgi:hypothetical protein